jgi:hypothetical protein
VHASFLSGAAQPGSPADPTDPYITAEATALNNDPNAIFTFVRDQVANQIYSGSLRGARGTLWSMGGNSLDKASLLIALLGAAGFSAQYVEGTLTNTAASNAILATFPATTRVVGCIPTGTTLASPQTDPTLISSAADHFWVEYGSGNVALDPSTPGAQSGQTFAAVVNTFTAIPQSLKQMVTVTLNVETYAPLGGLGTPTSMLTQSFESDLLSGRPISVGTSLGQTVSGGGLFGPPQTVFTYTPYFLLGQADSDIETDPVVQGTAFTETFSNILFESYVTGIFLDVQAPDTAGTLQSYRHVILDRIGYANRQSGNLSPTLPTTTVPAIVPTQVVTLNVNPGLQAQDTQTFTNQRTRISNEQTKLQALQGQTSTLPTTGTLTAAQQTLVNNLITAESDLQIALNELLTLSFAATADRILGQAEQEYRANAYYTSPRVTLGVASQTGSFSLDLLKRDIKVIASPGQNASVPMWFEETRGLIESSSEAAVIQSALGQQSVDISAVLSAAGSNIVALLPGATGQTLPAMSADAVARIQTALNNNKFVVAPTSTQTISGNPVEGWLEIDQTTGETVSTFADGDHQGGAEYTASLLESLFGQNFQFIGNIAGFGLGGISFMSGVLNGVAAFAANGKLAKTTVAGGGANSPLAPFVQQAFANLQTAIDNLPGANLPPGEGKSLVDSLTSGLAQGVKYASAVLVRSLPADPETLPFLSTDIIPGPASIAPGSSAGVNLNIDLDQYFTAPTTNGTEVPSIFIANIQNAGPTPDTYNLSFGSVPGYTVQSSVSSITVPPGVTAQVGVCLIPTGAAAPATTLSASVTSTSNPAIGASSTVGVNGGAVPVAVTIQASPTGASFVANGTTYTGSTILKLAPGSNLTVNAPNVSSNGTQYSFNSWSDGGAQTHSITVPSSATTYTASFTTSYLLTTGVNPAAGGTAAATGSNGYYAAGTVVNLTAKAASGYSFQSWTGAVANSANASTTVTMSAPESVTANFAVANANITIQTNPAGLEVSVDNGAPQAAPLSESWQAASKHTISTVATQGSNGTQYNFKSWNDSGALSHAITVPGSATTYTASFTTSYLLTLSANPAADGTASATTAGSNGYYPAGTVVGLTATPSSGYAFQSWNGAVANSANASTTVTMSGPETASATFASAIANVTGSVSITATPFIYSRASKTFNTTYTVKNIGTKTIAGPVSLVLSGLPAGVTVSNASGTYLGNPFLALGSGTLTAGASITVPVQISDPANASLQPTSSVYSGVL